MALQGGLRWPDSFARLFLDVLPDHLVTQIAESAGSLAQLPNHWMSMEAIKHIPTYPAPYLAVVEQAIQSLYAGVIQHLLLEQPVGIAGAEWWVQVYEGGRGLDFHFDKDEERFKKDMTMKQPWLSTVLYLHGDSQKRLGPTVVVDQLYDSRDRCAVPSMPSKCALVCPLKGAHLVFDGHLAHGVLSSLHANRRATLLINWWREKPEGIDPMSQGEAVPANSLPCETSRACQFHQSLPVPQPVPTVSLPNPGQEPLLVDDLLADAKFTVTGPDAVHALAFEHEGYQLFPLQADQEALADTQNPTIAAAFVPVGESDVDCP